MIERLYTWVEISREWCVQLVVAGSLLCSAAVLQTAA